MEAVDVGRDRLMLLPRRKVDTMDFNPVEMIIDLLLLLKFLLCSDPASTFKVEKINSLRLSLHICDVCIV